MFNFDDESQTPVFPFYEDADDGVISHAEEAKEKPTPISSDNYIGTEVTLSRVDKMV